MVATLPHVRAWAWSSSGPSWSAGGSGRARCTGQGRRFVQLTPRGSGCSIQVSAGYFHDLVPGSLRGSVLVVPDIRSAHAQLVENGGVVVSEDGVTFKPALQTGPRRGRPRQRRVGPLQRPRRERVVRAADRQPSTDADLRLTWTWEAVPSCVCELRPSTAGRTCPPPGPITSRPATAAGYLARLPLGDTRTQVTVQEFAYRTAGARDMSRVGMKQCLDKMAAMFHSPTGHGDVMTATGRPQALPERSGSG